jgi:hypothetical protein
MLGLERQETAMRRSHLVLTGVAIAGAAVTGSAYTAANVVPDSVAGFGQGTVTGATVVDVNYTPYLSDNTDLGSVEFISSTELDEVLHNATLTLKAGVDDAATPLVDGTYTCDIGTWNSGTSRVSIVCDTTSNHPDFDTFQTVGLTVVD